MEFVEAAQEVGLGVEVTAVAVPEVEISKIEKMASRLGVMFRAGQYRSFVW